MSNVDVQLGSLDFEGIKSSIIDHLKTQDTIKDYNYDGSAAQVLLDILAYNTLYYGYYANMIASEMFLDTAQKEESIISLVKPLGYVVPGKTSAKAKVKIRVGGANTPVPKYTKFSGSNSDGTSYNFYTLEPSVLDSDGENVLIVTEGKNLINEQPLSIDNTTQKGFIFGLDIDITTITVEVYNSTTSKWEEWNLVSNIESGLNETSKVYWLERSELGFFVVFGSNFDSSYSQIGASIEANQQVRVSYLKSSGEKANNIGKFSIRGFSVATALTDTISVSSNGSDGPNLEAIKFFAPKWFASQNRAVTVEDCRGVLAEAGFVEGDGDPYSRFTVWGGEEMDPPRYGRLFVSLNQSDLENPFAKANAIDILEKKTVVGVIPEFMNLDVNEVLVEGSLVYDPFRSTQTETQLINLAEERLRELYGSKFNLENVDSSYIATEINSLNNAFSVSSNDLKLMLVKTLEVQSNGLVEPKSYNNKCLEGSLHTDLFTPSLFAKGENQLNMDDAPVGAKIRLVSNRDDVDTNGYQIIKAVYSTGSIDRVWNVGKWKPSTGDISIDENVTDENTLKLKVSPDSSGAEKFQIKFNMYNSGVSYNLIMEQVN